MDWDMAARRNDVTGPVACSTCPLPCGVTQADVDLGMSYRVGWSSAGLHFFVEVVDDIHANDRTPEALLWQQDSLQVGLDADPQVQGLDARCNATDGPYDDLFLEVGWALNTARSAVEIHQWNPDNDTPPVSGTVVRTGFTATHYEITIPFTTLGITTPTAGQEIRFNLLANDSDVTADPNDCWREAVLELADGINTCKNSLLFGTLILN